MSNYYKMEKEISFNQLASLVLKRKRLFIAYILIFFSVGLIIGFVSEKEFTSRMIIKPELGGDNKMNSGFSDLASLAGVNLGSSDFGYMSPSLYPVFLKSKNFQLDVLRDSIDVSGRLEKVLVYEYYDQIYRPGFFMRAREILGTIKNVFGSIKSDSQYVQVDNNPLRITKKQAKYMKMFTADIDIEVKDKDGYVIITANTPDPIVSAALVKTVNNRLANEILEAKTKKAQANLEFLQKQLKVKEEEFKSIQSDLARISDSNLGLTTSQGQTIIRNAQSRYDLIFQVYLDLAKKTETAKIKVEDETPVFTIIEDAFIPIERSAPKRTLILISNLTLGTLLFLIHLFLNLYWVKLRAQ